MRNACTWRIGLVGLMLLGGCEERSPAPAAERRPPTPSVLPAPERSEVQEAAPDAGADPVPDWSPVEAAGVPGSVLSQDRRFAFVVPAGDRVRHIDIHDAATQRRLTHIALDKATVVRSTNARVRWTAGNNLLLTWSAGSDVTSGIVYGTDGKVLLQLTGAGMELSPSRRYLATFPTLFAAPPVIELYDLSAGRKVDRRVASEGTFWVVDEIGWQKGQLVARCRTQKEQLEEVRMALDARP